MCVYVHLGSIIHLSVIIYVYHTVYVYMIYVYVYARSHKSLLFLHLAAMELRTCMCLSALSVGKCSANCSQAVNTLLMPMANKMCQCFSQYREPVSEMLRIIEIDARTLPVPTATGYCVWSISMQ